MSRDSLCSGHRQRSDGVAVCRIGTGCVGGVGHFEHLNAVEDGQGFQRERLDGGKWEEILGSNHEE